MAEKKQLLLLCATYTHAIQSTTPTINLQAYIPTSYSLQKFNYHTPGEYLNDMPEIQPV